MTPTTTSPSELGAAHCSATVDCPRLCAALDGQNIIAGIANKMEAERDAARLSAVEAQRNALAEARIRIIARIEDNKRWGDPLDQESGLQEARRIIGAMWDDLPVTKPQAVIEHEAHIRRVITEQNAEVSEPGGQVRPDSRET